jgi:hypothetical protein
MARPTKQVTDEALLTLARSRFDEIESASHDDRMFSLQDRRFYSIAGAQWEGSFADQFENRPRLEVNKVHKGVLRIINEYRNNRISVEFIPKDGSESDDLAEACNGLYRADEEDSCAEEALDNAFEEAVGGGFGAFRLRTELEDEYGDYDDEDDERQRIRFEPIFDADSCVYFDLNARRQDKSDAMFAFVLTPMTRTAYVDTYEDNPATWPHAVSLNEFDWQTPDVVYVAEYYQVEKVIENEHIYRDVNGEEERYSDDDIEDEETIALIQALAMTKVKTVKRKRKKVSKTVLSGGKVLEKKTFIAGSNIPIVPVYGKRWFVDNRERFMGHVRLAKDVQRLKNMQLSRLAEISAYSPVRKPIFTPEQVAGHEVAWADDNVKNRPYMLLNAVTDANGSEQPMGPLGYTEPPNIPEPLAALLQITEQDMQDLMGANEAAEEMQPNISGKAIELIQTRLDQNNFIYMSNMAKAVKRAGEIWLGMAKDIYVEPNRKMKTVSMDGTVGNVTLAEPAIDETTGRVYNNIDMGRAKFDTTVTVGPSSVSKRAATVRSLVGMLQFAADPETQTILTSMAMMNMEGEGLKDTRAFFRKRLVRMGAVEPTEKETQEMEAELAAQGEQPDPNAEFLAAEAEKSKSQAALNVAKIDETKAKTAETLANIDSQRKSDVISMIDVIRDPASRKTESSGDT